MRAYIATKGVATCAPPANTGAVLPPMHLAGKFGFLARNATMSHYPYAPEPRLAATRLLMSPTTACTLDTRFDIPARRVVNGKISESSRLGR